MIIVEESRKYVASLFEKVDLKVLSYHNWYHTQNVHKAALLIAENTEGISDQQKEYLSLAAFFHDTGYIESSDNHELRGAEIASKFLEEHSYDTAGIQEINRLILATKLGHKPADELEKIMMDADLSHLGRKDYLVTTYKFLSNEINVMKKITLSAREWAESCVSFLSSHQFYTAFAQDYYGKEKMKNLDRVKNLLEETSTDEELETKLAEQEKKDKKEKKNKKGKKGNGKKGDIKGVETMFRTSLRNHVNLSRIADNKANTLISVNAIIISIVLSALFPKLDSNPFLFYPSITILIGSFVTIILSILSTIPNVTHGLIGKDEVISGKGNLLFFGNFHKMTLEDYEWSMSQLMENKDYIYGSLTRDLFFLGKVLNKKYSLLRWAYYIFMIGLLLSILVFIINVIPYIGTTSAVDLSVDSPGLF